MHCAYDIYGGVGTIGILLSKYFEKVITVESEPSNVDMIGINAKLNEIKNIKPLLLDARTPWTISDTESSVALVDPPRTGLMPAGVDQILTLSPRLLIYISCNPITQKEDLKTLLTEYDLLELKGFDMFPQTLHMESVAILRKKVV